MIKPTYLPKCKFWQVMTTHSERCGLAKIYILTSMFVQIHKVLYWPKMHLCVEFGDDMWKRLSVIHDLSFGKKTQKN